MRTPPVSGQAWGAIAVALMMATAIARGSPMSSQDLPVGALADVELATPFTVSEVKGRILSWRRQPLEGASFRLSTGANTSLRVLTDDAGSFIFDQRRPSWIFRLRYPSLANAWTIAPGTYRFTASHQGFHATTGTVIVSAEAPKDSVIAVELQPGPDADDRTFEQRADDWAKAQLPPCAPAVNRSPKRGKYPGAVVDVPIALGLCAVRTPEFVAKKAPYRFMLEADRSLGFDRMYCMLGMFSGLLQRRDFNCLDADPLLKADWTVWAGSQAVARGSSPLEGYGNWSESLAKTMGRFEAEAGKKYVIEVKFLKDSSAINAANPHLVVQRTR